VISFYFGLEASDGECPASANLYRELRAQNREVRAAKNLVKASDKWRLATEKTPSPALPPPPPGVATPPPMKTMVQLHAPGYFGSEALVILYFNWSMHGAAARYLLHSDGSRWEVQCSKLLFYP